MVDAKHLKTRLNFYVCMHNCNVAIDSYSKTAKLYAGVHPVWLLLLFAANYTQIVWTCIVRCKLLPEAESLTFWYMILLSSLVWVQSCTGTRWEGHYITFRIITILKWSKIKKVIFEKNWNKINSFYCSSNTYGDQRFVRGSCSRFECQN